MINAKLQNIIDTKSAIGNAIVNKGGTITSETPFFNYAAQIDGISTGSVLTGNATVGEVFNGQTFYSNDANTQLTGTFVFDGNATVANVETGRTFFATNGTKLTGTLVPATPSTIDGTDESFMPYITASNLYDSSGLQAITANNGFVFASFTSQILRKFNGSNLDFVTNTSVNAGGVIYNLATFNGSVYVGAGFSDGFVRRYSESTLEIEDNSANYGTFIYAIAANNGSIFFGGSTPSTIIKTTADLSTIGNTDSYGGTIRAIAINNGFVYAGGVTTRTVRKYHESNLAYVGETANYGGTIRSIAISNGFIYAGGEATQTVTQYHESNLAFAANTISYGSNIHSIKVDNGFIYAVGTQLVNSAALIRKYYESNLAFIANSASYGGELLAMDIKGNNIYIGGAISRKVQMFLKSTQFTNSLNGTAWYIIPK
jgi:hypothetical protein